MIQMFSAFVFPVLQARTRSTAQRVCFAETAFEAVLTLFDWNPHRHANVVTA